MSAYLNFEPEKEPPANSLHSNKIAIEQKELACKLLKSHNRLKYYGDFELVLWMMSVVYRGIWHAGKQVFPGS